MYDMKDIEVSRLANKSPVDYASWLDNMFLHETTRKVNGDSTVLIDNLLFDVPSIYISIGVGTMSRKSAIIYCLRYSVFHIISIL